MKSRNVNPSSGMYHSLFLARVVILVLLLNAAAAAQGATITVFSAEDSGLGTLRQAIFDASSGDMINFAITFPFPGFPREIRLQSELLINKSLTIDGPAGGLTVRIQFFDGFRTFHIAPASVTATISGLIITGGGILNTGTLAINNCTISGNFTQGNGGGIANTGTLAIANSTISGNSSFFGGGVANFNGGTLTITNSTVSGNTVAGQSSPCGGGIFTGAGSSTAARCTIIALNNGRVALMFVDL